MKKYKKKFDVFKVIVDKDDPVIVEVGAHFGEDSLRLAETFANSSIYCFEPDPRCIELFKKHVTNDNIKLYEIALSNVEGELEFYQSFEEYDEDTPEKYDWISNEDYVNKKLNGSGASSLKKGYPHASLEPIKVKSLRFDTWCTDKDIKHVDLAWIDTQGAEKEVLDGMGASISLIKFIWIEYGEIQYEGAMSREQTIDHLRGRGFKEINMLSGAGPTGDLLFQRAE